MSPSALQRQKGVTLIVGLIMLVLITLMVTTAFTLSGTNLKAVGNMQFRNESIAAANKAIEQVVGVNFQTGFMSVPPVQNISFDINNDGTKDYDVKVGTEVPPGSGNWVGAVCIQSTQVAGSGSSGSCSSATLEGFTCAAPNYSTLWDIDASVTDVVSGASVRVRQGVRVELTEVQRNAVCPL